MTNFWFNFAIEIGFFTLLGILYYFYQKRKIVNFEKNKGPIIMGQILQSCLIERGDAPNPELDPIIEQIDDYLHNHSQYPPTALLKIYAQSKQCSKELKNIIESGLLELKADEK